VNTEPLAYKAAERQADEVDCADLEMVEQLQDVSAEPVGRVGTGRNLRASVPAEVISQHPAAFDERRDLRIPHAQRRRNRVCEHDDGAVVGTFKAVGEPDSVAGCECLRAGHRSWILSSWWKRHTGSGCAHKQNAIDRARRPRSLLRGPQSACPLPCAGDERGYSGDDPGCEPGQGQQHAERDTYDKDRDHHDRETDSGQQHHREQPGDAGKEGHEHKPDPRAQVCQLIS
jgi:hypothetical protein